MLFGTAEEGLHVVSKALDTDPVIDPVRYKTGYEQWQARGYGLTHGPAGYGYYGLPLPWGATPEIDYFLRANLHGPSLPVLVIEYYNGGLDHYFITGDAGEAAILDAGTSIKGWKRTGYTINAYRSSQAGMSPACRFYIPPQHGNSHFFSVDPAECNVVLAKSPSDPDFSGYLYETPNAFYMALADETSGNCPAATDPVYRLWNQRVDSNHRYTVDRSVRDTMLARGYLAEGNGPDGVVMCAPR